MTTSRYRRSGFVSLRHHDAVDTATSPGDSARQEMLIGKIDI
jgi:hypothetical protein